MPHLSETVLGCFRGRLHLTGDFCCTCPEWYLSQKIIAQHVAICCVGWLPSCNLAGNRRLKVEVEDLGLLDALYELEYGIATLHLWICVLFRIYVYVYIEIYIYPSFFLTFYIYIYNIYISLSLSIYLFIYLPIFACYDARVWFAKLAMVTKRHQISLYKLFLANGCGCQFSQVAVLLAV